MYIHYQVQLCSNNKLKDRAYDDTLREVFSKYESSSYFDNVTWIMLDVNERDFTFILTFNEDSGTIDQFMEGLNGIKRGSKHSELTITFSEISLSEYVEKMEDGSKKGFEFNNTGYETPEQKFEYIHDLYSEKFDQD